MTTKILHLSDTHFGQHGPARHAADMDVLHRIIDYARETEVSAILHTGDLFHKPDPDSGVIDDVASELASERRYVRGWEDYCIPFYYIRGDTGHDLGPHAETPALNALSSLQFVKMMWPETAHHVGEDNVALCGVPTHMNAHFESKSNSTFDFALRTDCEFAILCCHLTLKNVYTGGRMSWKDQYSMRNIQQTVETDLDLLACGDLHSFRKGSARRTPFVYAGSPTDRYNGPGNDPEVVLYTIESGDCTVSDISVWQPPVSSPPVVFLQPNAGIDEVINPVVQNLQNGEIENACIDVTISDQNTTVSISDIDSYFKDRDAQHVSVRDIRSSP